MPHITAERLHQVTPCAAAAASGGSGDSGRTEGAARLDTSPSQKLKTAFCYMDELFHIPQTLQYAIDGNYDTYDPMITTPPGAYVLPALAVRSVLPRGAAAVATVATDGVQISDNQSSFEGVERLARRITSVCATTELWGCGMVGEWFAFLQPYFNAEQLFQIQSFGEAVFVARLTNLCVHLTIWLWFAVFVSRCTTDGEAVGRLVLAAMFPPLMFSSTLVYTDVASAAVVLLAWYAAPNGFRPLSFASYLRIVLVALIGLLSLWMRQTNIVWIFFIGARFVCEAWISVYYQPERKRRMVWVVLRTMVIASPLLLVPLAFGWFLVWNGGIVLGDKSSHQPVLHGAQLCYLFGFVALCSPFQCLRACTQRLRSLRWWIAVVGWGVVSVALLDSSVYFHPYLTADNRHFTNIFYRRVLLSRVVRLVVVGGLSAAGALTTFDAILGDTSFQTVLASLTRANSSSSSLNNASKIARFGSSVHTQMRRVEAFLWLFCSAICCVPQHLIEPRYFVPSFVLLQLLACNRRSFSAPASEKHYQWQAVHWDVVWLLAVHVGTSWLFVEKTFTAPDGTVGRYMW